MKRTLRPYELKAVKFQDSKLWQKLAFIAFLAFAVFSIDIKKDELVEKACGHKHLKSSKFCDRKGK